MGKSEAAPASSDFDHEVDAAFATIAEQEKVIAEGVRDSSIRAIRLGHEVLNAVHRDNPDVYYRAYARLNDRE